MSKLKKFYTNFFVAVVAVIALAMTMFSMITMLNALSGIIVLTHPTSTFFLVITVVAGLIYATYKSNPTRITARKENIQ